MSYDTRQRDETPREETPDEQSASYEETPGPDEHAASYEETPRPDAPDEPNAVPSADYPGEPPSADYPGEAPEPYRTDDRVAEQTAIDGETAVDGQPAAEGEPAIDGQTAIDGESAIDDENLVEEMREGDPLPGEPVPVPPGVGPSVPATAPTPDGAVAGTATPEPASTTLWAHDESADFQGRWREVQLRFVDDPRGATEEAEALASEVVERFTAAVTARKRELDGWRDHAGESDPDGGDTERMRVAVRHYRQLLDRIFQA